MIKFIYRDHLLPKKNVLLFIHGFIGSEESWLGKGEEVKIPEHLHSFEYLQKNYDFALFSYYTRLTSIFDNTYASIRYTSDKIPLIKKVTNFFFKRKKEFKANIKITEIANILKTEIKTNLREYDRIVIVAHSMGGLVTKSYIVDLLERANDENIRNKRDREKSLEISNKIAGYISIAVPHNGSNLANIGQIILNNPQIKDIATLENYIYSVTNKWLLSKNLPLTAYFQCKYDNIVVDNSSKGYDIRNIDTESFEYDHFSVLKPQLGDTIIKTLYDTIINFETEDPKQYYYDLVNYFIGKKDDGEAALKSFIVDHENEDFRSSKFQELKKKAKCSITIMGVGITNILETEISEYLDRGISIRLLMMNPNILLEHFNLIRNLTREVEDDDYLSAFDMMLKNNHIGDFYQRANYNGRLIAKFEGLKKFVNKIKDEYNKDPEKGSIEMLVFNSFIPISFTSINTFADEGKIKEGVEEFIVEFALPYSERRIHIPFSKQNDLKLFNTFINSIEKLRGKSVSAETITLNKNFQNG